LEYRSVLFRRLTRRLDLEPTQPKSSPYSLGQYEEYLPHNSQSKNDDTRDHPDRFQQSTLTGETPSTSTKAALTLAAS
jgi:hypothetical protein